MLTEERFTRILSILESMGLSLIHIYVYKRQVQGMRPLIGYNYGAGESKRVREIFRSALVLIAGVMVIEMCIRDSS